MLIEVLLPSVAVTRITSVPTSPLPGVPEKVPVAGLKVIQPGSGDPSARVALSVRVSPSGSLKVPAGTVKLKPPEWWRLHRTRVAPNTPGARPSPPTGRT
ncbi:hypothetical protein QTI90_23840 [Pectobacterium brasiliense]|nr:hypothetical protein [Pectobacterium brasiliense]WJM81174.1 hypothetical protein QTI90_23840 [Pectobacterium brasiliense]